MERHKNNWLYELIVLSGYKICFEFIYLQRYMYIFNYMYTNYYYHFNLVKWIISNVIFLLFMIFLLYSQSNLMYSLLIRFVYLLCIIPCLGVYACFDGIETTIIAYPTLFMVVFIIVLNKYADNRNNDDQFTIKFPRIKNINTYLLAVSALIAIAIWMWRGHPVILGLGAAKDQRIYLRANGMPTLLLYVFILLGSTVFPYLYAMFFDEKNYIKSFACLACGLLLFFVNGMKTWLFLYLFYFGIVFIFMLGNKASVSVFVVLEILFLLLITFSVIAYDVFHIIDFIGIYARVTVNPNDIGFSFVSFFKNPSNPYLYLRESILRHFFETPYLNGSDFYVLNGTDVDISSTRFNNGLWGDAYRNFGLVGIFLYPIFIAKALNTILKNSEHMTSSLRLFIVFMALWSSINTSFFTWLLTGGVILIVILEKIDKSNMQYCFIELTLDV